MIDQPEYDGFLSFARRFTQTEKDLLSNMYKHRCSVMKDYRFSVSYGAYLLGDRCIRQITHLWTYLNPDVQKGPFQPEEDVLLFQHANQTPAFSWPTLAATYLPERSAAQCRQRYCQLTKTRATRKKVTVYRAHVSPLSFVRHRKMSLAQMLSNGCIHRHALLHTKGFHR